MKKNLLKLVLTIMIILMIFIFIILGVQQDLFFYPWHDNESYNELLNEENFEEVKIDNNGKLLNGWLKYNIPKEQKAPLLIFFGGNAQNSSNTCMDFLINNRYQYFDGYNVMIIDYPGYGLSEGTPSDTTMFEAALKVYDYACNLDCVDTDNIIVLGFSIGTGVATYVASQRDVNGLILIAPYDQALSLYNNTLNIFYGPLKMLAKYKFNSISYAPNVKVSPLIITSYDDEVINYNFTLNLINYFNDVEETILLEGVTHNRYFSQESVLININEYLQKRLKTEIGENKGGV